jgi:hypothetical protein
MVSPVVMVVRHVILPSKVGAEKYTYTNKKSFCGNKILDAKVQK